MVILVTTNGGKYIDYYITTDLSAQSYSRLSIQTVYKKLGN